MPWKNGGGETREIAVFPEGASVETFEWRISAATVNVSGPFSIFPGVDRTFVVLSGGGIHLALGDAPPARLDTGTEPVSFSGDLTVTASLLDGPIEDLNVMTRTGKMAHRVVRHRVEKELRLPSLDGWTLLFDPASNDDPAVLCERRDGQRHDIRIGRPADLYVIDIWRV